MRLMINLMTLQAMKIKTMEERAAAIVRSLLCLLFSELLRLLLLSVNDSLLLVGLTLQLLPDCGEDQQVDYGE